MKFMLFILAVLSACVCVAAPPDSVSASNTEQFYVHGSYEKTCQFLERNTVAIVEAGDAQVLEQRGDRLRIKHVARKETNVFIAESTKGKGVYKTSLVKSEVGNLKAYVTEIKVESGSRGTLVTISNRATIANSRVKQREIVIVLKRSASGVRKFLEKNVR